MYLRIIKKPGRDPDTLKRRTHSIWETLKSANVPVDLNKLTPEEQRKLAERIGFKIGNVGLNFTFKPLINLDSGKLQLGNNFLFEAGSGVTVSGSGSANSNCSTAVSGGSANGQPIASAIASMLSIPVKIGNQLYNVFALVVNNITHPVETTKRIFGQFGLGNGTLANIFKNFGIKLNNTTGNGMNLGQNLFARLRNGTTGVTKFVSNIFTGGLCNLLNFGNRINSTTSYLISGVRQMAQKMINESRNFFVNNPIRNIVVVFTNSTRGLIARGVLLINNFNPINWIKTLFTRSQGTTNNMIQNYWKEVLPKLTNNSVVLGVFGVRNKTDQFFVVTTNAIIGITNTSANGVSNYSINFIANVKNLTQIAYGKMSSAGILYLTTRSNSSGILNSLYVLINGTLQEISNNLIQGGGMAWNQDNSKFYVADSGGNVVYQYNIAPNGTIYNQSVFYSATTNPQYTGTIKDVLVDQKGNVWILMQPTDGSTVYLLQLNPNTGAVERWKSTAFTQATSMILNSDGSITVNGTYGTNTNSSGSSNSSGGLTVTINYGGGSYTFDGGSSASGTSSFSFNP